MKAVIRRAGDTWLKCTVNGRIAAVAMKNVFPLAKMMKDIPLTDVSDEEIDYMKENGLFDGYKLFADAADVPIAFVHPAAVPLVMACLDPRQWNQVHNEGNG